ncbi:RNA polymerase, sigma-24 subunit, ECF subfamily [Chitinophaga pinensis DSM 2588]|uniref:RNA polymerase, sigma-24 subunit, ECF subfamily n=2 Tax=Chitinophaga pinensis TaxID=79329 RepID=A0A979G2R2_CHIPD|nr:RNA polymerase, sigma-24 subunit, ECF subfamily [Chitinophaga pinensis DSM 2588]
MCMIDYQDDPELLHRLSNNDQLAFKMIYEKYERFLYLLAYKNLQNKEGVEDLVQEIFIALWKKRSTATTILVLKAYLIRMCEYKVWKKNNAPKKTSSLDAMSYDTASQVLGRATDDSAMEHELIYLDQLSQFKNNLAKIHGTKRADVFIKVKVELLDEEDVAQSENITVGTVRKHVATVMKYLREQVQSKNQITPNPPHSL